MSTSQSLPAWKEEINAKVSEHRSRHKLAPDAQSRLAELEPSFATTRQPAASRIAARVAERYAKAPSYREMLEQEVDQAPARLIHRVPEAKAAPVLAPDPAPEPSLFENSPAPVASAAPLPADTPASRLRWADFTTLAPSPTLPAPQFPASSPTPPSSNPTRIPPPRRPPNQPPLLKWNPPS